MKGVVPAAGAGTRLGSLTETRPKGLVDVAGQPLLEYVFDALAPLDLAEIVVVVGYRGDQIRDHFGDEVEGTPLRYVTQETRSGLAHALLAAETHVREPFVLLNGDNVVRANVVEMVAVHREAGAAATTLVERVSPARASKGAVFETDDGTITGAVEKPADPPSTLVPRGIFTFSPVIFHACHLVTPARTNEYELSDAIDLLLAAGRSVETVPLRGWCHNVNTPTDVATVTERLENDRA